MIALNQITLVIFSLISSNLSNFHLVSPNVL